MQVVQDWARVEDLCPNQQSAIRDCRVSMSLEVREGRVQLRRRSYEKQVLVAFVKVTLTRCHGFLPVDPPTRADIS